VQPAALTVAILPMVAGLVGFRFAARFVTPPPAPVPETLVPA
jgi:hypothetical protein